jgi:large subunit ribosomal protein L20
LYGAAVEQVHNAWADAFAHRRRRKRDFRRLWITRIGAAARLHGMSYSRLVGALRRSGIAIDRKILADLALSDPGGFKAVLDAAGR